MMGHERMHDDDHASAEIEHPAIAVEQQMIAYPTTFNANTSAALFGGSPVA